MNNLFYTQSIEDNFLTLHDKEASHATQVLRKKVGDTIHVIDGEGSAYECTIEEISKRAVKCAILRKTFYPPSETLTVAVAPTKNRDRLEWMIEKLVEIGVKEIFLLHTKNTERSRTNIDRIEKKILSAVKQSLRFYIPKIEELKFEEAISLEAPVKYIAHCYDGMKKTEAKSDNGMHKLVLIGPEGDFTNEEVEMALTAGFVGLDLGQFRLRTETAAIVAAARL